MLDAGGKVLAGDAARKLSPSAKTVYEHVDLDNICIADDFPEPEPTMPKDLDDEAWEEHPLMLAWQEREKLWQPRTYRALLEGLKYKPVVIEDPKTKGVRELLPFRDAQQLLKKKGIDLPSYYNRKRPKPVTQASRAASERNDDNWKEQARREQEKRQAEEHVRLAILKEVFPKVKPALTREVLANVVRNIDVQLDDVLQALFGHADARKLKEPDLARILVALDAVQDANQTYSPAKELLALAAKLKVDAVAIRKRVLKEREKQLEPNAKESHHKLGSKE